MKRINNLAAIMLIIFICFTNDKTDAQPNKNKSEKSQGFDISKINVCELIPDDLLASEIGGKVLKPARHSDYGTIKGCEYEIDPAGPDKYEYCAIWLSPSSMYEDSQSALETTKGLNQKATVEALKGYGDESYVIHNSSEDQSIIHILLKDKVYIEVKAEKFEDAKKIAKLILSKLK